MSFDIISALGVAGEVAAGFVPGLSPVLKGVGALAKMVGGDAGDKINAGLSQISDGIETIAKTPLTPEQTIEQQKITATTNVALAELGFKKKKLDYDDAAGGRDVIKTALLSKDPIIAQARPKMMILLGKVSMGYTILTPILIVILAMGNIDKALLGLLTNMIVYQGATLWAAFMTSFTGYTVARSVDKNTQAKSENGMSQSNLLKIAGQIGKVVS